MISWLVVAIVQDPFVAQTLTALHISRLLLREGVFFGAVSDGFRVPDRKSVV